MMAASLHSIRRQLRPRPAAGLRPVSDLVPASPGPGAHCIRGGASLAPAARATDAHASCAAPSKAGSRRTTAAIAISTCVSRPARASGARSTSRRTSHVTMAWSARSEAAAPLSSSASTALAPLNSPAVHPHQPGDGLRRPAQDDHRFRLCRRRANAFGLSLRARTCRQAGGRAAALCFAAYPFPSLLHLRLPSCASQESMGIFADVQKVFAEFANA